MDFGISRLGLRGFVAAGFAPVILAVAAPAGAQGNSATASGLVMATVITPVTASELSGLDFGLVASNPAKSGSVTVPAAAGNANYAGGARNACGASACPAAHAARFLVTGEANRSYSVATPGEVRVKGIAGNGGSAPILTVGALTVRTDSRPGAGPHGQLNANGTDQFGLGGVLQVPAGLDAARYSVSVPVVLTYS